MTLRTESFEAASDVPVEAAALYAWHARPGAFERLTPPWERVRVAARRGGIEAGDELELHLSKGPLRLTWVARHLAPVPGEEFSDEQVRGPFAHWVHTHRMVPVGPGASRLVDHVRYRLPGGRLGLALGGRSARKALERMFRYRHSVTVNDMTRHASFAAERPLHIVVSGASGLVGEALVAYLSTAGHRVDRLVRRPNARRSEGEISWDPARGTIDAAALEGVDAVVHLAGAGVADGRWTAARRALIRNSRVDGTLALATALAALERPPRVLVAASAIGFYGDRSDAPLDEQSGRGDGFLAEVVQAWEAATEPAAAAGVRVVRLRLGVVLSPRGGALAKLLTPFRLGVGGRIGGGRQWMSWIALDDVLALVEHALFDEGLAGPVNAVAPEPVENRTFTATLARVLRRPALLPLPRWAIEALFGDMGRETLLASARVLPRAAEARGFRFSWPTLEPALMHLLGRAA